MLQLADGAEAGLESPSSPKSKSVRQKNRAIGSDDDDSDEDPGNQVLWLNCVDHCIYLSPAIDAQSNLAKARFALDFDPSPGCAVARLSMVRLLTARNWCRF